MYTCVICDRTFTEADLEDATQIGGGHGRSRRPMTYVFGGGYHYLRKIPKPKQQSQPQSVSEPKEDVALLLEANVLAALPTPPEPEPEETSALAELPPIEEDKLLTAMQVAWLNRRSK